MTMELRNGFMTGLGIVKRVGNALIIDDERLKAKINFGRGGEQGKDFPLRLVYEGFFNSSDTGNISFVFAANIRNIEFHFEALDKGKQVEILPNMIFMPGNAYWSVPELEGWPWTEAPYTIFESLIY